MENRTKRYRVRLKRTICNLQFALSLKAIKHLSALITLLLIAILGFSSCVEDDMVFPKRDSSQKDANVLETFNFFKTERGKKMWDLSALRAEIYRDEGTIYVYTMKLNFYEGDVLISTLQADKGILYQDKGNMEIENNVKIISHKNDTFIETEKLFWDEESGKVTSPSFVRETRPDAIITGYGLEADPGLEKVVIKEKVRVVSHSENN